MKITASNKPQIPKYQTGLSLIELMVAMAIQFILLAGMVYVYGSSRTMFTVNQELSRVQETGRYATDLLLYDIRMAGFAGCRNISEIIPNIIANSPPAFSAISDSLTVFEDGTGWTNPTATARLAGTDVITLQSTQGSGVSLTGNMAADNANIQVGGNPDGLQANDLVLISDCSRADLFRATGVSTGGGTVTITHANSTNTTNRLSKAYQDDAQVMSFDAHTYFIGTDANGEPGLYQYSFNTASAVLLAQGVEGMQLLLAEDTSGDSEPDIYVNADAVTEWDAVIGVRVGLLMRSADGAASDARDFNFDGNEANTGSDRRLRKVFWSYAALRNRI